MNNFRKSIINLNEDCQLEIMKYIIADCEMKDESQGYLMNYANLVNFALAHEDFEAILEGYYNDLYKSLKFVFVAKSEELEIDFSELQTLHKGKGADAFWRIYSDAIRQNNVLRKVLLNYDPKSFQPDFLHNFDTIKRALENKKSLRTVTIGINGYSLDDLQNFGHITNLSLEVRMSADALVNVCKSNPHLNKLCFLSTEILGRLSDIVPHCRNLKYLTFVPKPDIDLGEYAPLAELPNLQEMNIYDAFENGSLLTIFEAITKWQRLAIQPLKITFTGVLPHLSNVTIARVNSLLHLQLKDDPEGIVLETSYDFWDISRDSSPLEQSLATITLIKADLIIDYKGLTLYKCLTSDIDKIGFLSLLKTFNIRTFILQGKKDKIQIEKLFSPIIPDESYALKSVNTYCRKIDRFDTSELVKIKSITSWTCRFSDWESVELLSALNNLESVFIILDKDTEKTNSKALCSLLNTCAVGGVIRFADWCIEFRNENIRSQNKRIKTLKISGRGKEISHIFDALSYRDLVTMEELDISEYSQVKVKDILNVAEVNPFKKLKISLTNTNGIEHLADLTELEELVICNSARGSLIKLFDQLATNAATSMKCLQISSENLSTEEIVRVCKIRSLKKLDLGPNNASWQELANSNIEELTLTLSNFRCVTNLFAAFAAKTTTRIKHLNIRALPYIYMSVLELKELSKIKSLRSLRCSCLPNVLSVFRSFRHLVKLDISLSVPTSEGLQCVAELENLEYLTLFFREYVDTCPYLNDHIHNDNEDSVNRKYNDGNDNNVAVLHDLADLQNLNKLKILVHRGANLTNVYHAFASKNVKLTHLSATIGCVEELNEITKIKSLRKLNLFFVRPIGKNLTSLGELSELKCLQITLIVYDWYDYDIMDSVLPVLKCCKNIDRLLIDLTFMYRYYYKFLSDIHTLLKSIRDPSHQGPLAVIVTELDWDHEYSVIREYPIPDILVIYFENAYLKIFTSSENKILLLKNLNYKYIRIHK